MVSSAVNGLTMSNIPNEFCSLCKMLMVGNRALTVIYNVMLIVKARALHVHVQEKIIDEFMKLQILVFIFFFFTSFSQFT
jgi:hypothetical protein